MRWRALLLVAASAVLMPILPALAQEPGTTGTLLALINGARAASGLPPYSLNPLLAAAAQAHSEDMAARATTLLNQGESIGGAITHTGSDGSSAADRVASTGYAAIQVGEDIYATTQGPQAAFDWWMGSALHRNNILHPRFLEIGIGAAPGPEGSVMYTLVFAHSADSPVLPAPTLPPTPVTPTSTSPPTETSTPTASHTPAPTSTVARVQLPPAAAASAIPFPTDAFDANTETPVSEAGSVARDLPAWVILLAIGIALVGFALFSLLQPKHEQK